MHQTSKNVPPKCKKLAKICLENVFYLHSFILSGILNWEGGYSLIWATGIRGRAAGHGMVFWPRCPKQGIQFYFPLSYTVNRVWYYKTRDFNPDCEQSLCFPSLQEVRLKGHASERRVSFPDFA